MAVPAWPGAQLLGPFAANTFTAGSMTDFYIYAKGVSDAEMAKLIGWRDKDGSLVDGVLTNQLQARAAGDDAAVLGSTVAIEIDSDTSSPFFGYIRMNITVAASAS